MIFIFEKISREEFLLLDGVEGMVLQYRVEHFSQLTDAILGAYDLFGEPDEVTERLDRFLSLSEKYKHEIGYWSSAELPTDIAGLNTRSRHLLTLLAGFSKQAMQYGGKDWLDHSHMQAGEMACFLLGCYGLLKESGGGGTLTPLGNKVARHALSPEFNPLNEFTFEELQ